MKLWLMIIIISTSLLAMDLSEKITNLIRGNDIPAVEKLLQDGTDPNSTHKYWNESIPEPLIWRAISIKMAQLLIDHGVDTTKYHNKLLHLTIRDTHSPQLIPFYIARGADPKNLDIF